MNSIQISKDEAAAASAKAHEYRRAQIKLAMEGGLSEVTINGLVEIYETCQAVARSASARHEAGSDIKAEMIMAERIHLAIGFLRTSVLAELRGRIPKNEFEEELRLIVLAKELVEGSDLATLRRMQGESGSASND